MADAGTLSVEVVWIGTDPPMRVPVEVAAGATVADALAASGIDTFEVTAIERDGSLEGPDLVLLRSLVALARGRIIASGGISSIEDVLAVQAAERVRQVGPGKEGAKGSYTVYRLAEAG